VLEPLERTEGVDRLLATALVTLSWLRAEKGEPYADLLARAVELQRTSPPDRVADSADFVIAQQALFSDRYNDGRAALSRLIRRSEETGDDFSLPSLLANLAHLEFRAGRWDDSERALVEGRRLSEGQRQAFWQLTGAQLMMLTGLRGDRERAQAEVASLRSGELTTADPAWSAIVESCAGRVELAHGDADAAFATLSRAIALAESVDWTDPGQTGVDVTWFDAGIASGHLDEVEARLAIVEG